MGLISEEPASKTGFYNSGITIDRARTAVEALQERSRQADGPSLSSPAPELPFSRDAKRVFETAAEVLCPGILCALKNRCWYMLHPRVKCSSLLASKGREYTGSMPRNLACDVQEARKLGHNYISPEHVVLALFSVGNVGAKQVIEK